MACVGCAKGQDLKKGERAEQKGKPFVKFITLAFVIGLVIWMTRRRAF